MTTKEVAREVLDHLPEGLSLQQIAYEIYVRGEVAEGRAEIERGEGIPHEEAVREIRRWFR